MWILTRTSFSPGTGRGEVESFRFSSPFWAVVQHLVVVGRDMVVVVVGLRYCRCKSWSLDSGCLDSPDV